MVSSDFSVRFTHVSPLDKVSGFLPLGDGVWTAETEPLLAAARTGDQVALGKLMELFRTYLLVVADGELATAVRPKAQPSDVVQDTFLEAYKLFERFGGDRGEEFRVWLRAILLNKVSEAHNRYLAVGKRRADREQSLDQSGSVGPLRDGIAGDDSTPSARVVRDEEAVRVVQALDQLPEPHRQIVVWRNWEALPFAEIGRRLNRSEDAARMIYVRALERLQVELERGDGRSPSPGPG